MVWKRLAGQQEGGQALQGAWGWVYRELLTHCQTADISLTDGALRVTLCLSGCVCVCVWTYVSEQAVGADSDTLQTSRLCPFFICLELHSCRAHAQPHKCTLLSYPSQSATLLCWHAVDSPPNFPLTRTLCYVSVYTKGSERFRKHPGSGLGAIGVKCKWLWRLWQSTLFVDDWVEIWDEETGLEPPVINEPNLMNIITTQMRKSRKYTYTSKHTLMQCMWIHIEIHNNSFTSSPPLSDIHDRSSMPFAQRRNENKPRAILQG